MKKILVTGAAGEIGINTIKFLLSEGKYEITALDLKNRHNNSVLKKYKKRVNVVLGDVIDRGLIEALIKDHDIVIHLADVLPPFANISKNVAHEINYVGCENIVRAISYYNPNCHLFFASSMSIYGEKNDITIKSKIVISEDDYYSKAKNEAEKLIKEKIRNYTIYRLPLVLTNKYGNYPIKAKMNEQIEYITSIDAAYAFVKGINKIKDINKKIYNVTSGKTIDYCELVTNTLTYYGISWKLIDNRILKKDGLNNSLCNDGNDLNKIINYRSDTLADYYNRMKEHAKNRRLRILFAKPFVRRLKK